MAPSVMFVAAMFVSRSLLFMFRSVDNGELQQLPARETIRGGRKRMDERTLPDEPVDAAWSRTGVT